MITSSQILSPTGPIPEDWEEVQADWHQLVGAITLIEHFFHKQATRAPGMLLADEVGVGKTLQAVVFAAFLTWAVDTAAEGKLSSIPILSELPLLI